MLLTDTLTSSSHTMRAVNGFASIALHKGLLLHCVKAGLGLVDRRADVDRAVTASASSNTSRHGCFQMV